MIRPCPPPPDHHRAPTRGRPRLKARWAYAEDSPRPRTSARRRSPLLPDGRGAGRRHRRGPSSRPHRGAGARTARPAARAAAGAGHRLRRRADCTRTPDCVPRLAQGRAICCQLISVGGERTCGSPGVERELRRLGTRPVSSRPCTRPSIRLTDEASHPRSRPAFMPLIYHPRCRDGRRRGPARDRAPVAKRKRRRARCGLRRVAAGLGRVASLRGSGRATTR